MTAAPAHPLTVKWVLFGFRGRIGRKSFWLGALLMMLINGALVGYVASKASENGNLQMGDAQLLFIGLIILSAWFATAWAAPALAVKRLHDLSMPAALAVLLIIPAVAFFAFLYLAFAPSKQETNEHGPVPFPRN